MENATWDELLGQDLASKRANMVRRRFQLTKRNSDFLDELEANGCDPNTVINLALNTFIPKTYNSNFNQDEIIKATR